MNPQPPRKPLSRLEALAIAAISLAVLAVVGHSIAHLECLEREGPLSLALLRPVFGGDLGETHGQSYTGFVRTKEGWILSDNKYHHSDPRIARVLLDHSIDPVGLWAGELEHEHYTLVNSHGRPVSTDSGLHAAFVALHNAHRPQSPLPAEVATGNISNYRIRWVGIGLDIASLAALTGIVVGIRGVIFRGRTDNAAAVPTAACPAQTTTQATDRDAA